MTFEQKPFGLLRKNSIFNIDFIRNLKIKK